MIEITNNGHGNRVQIEDDVHRDARMQIVILGNDNVLTIGSKTRLAAGLIEIRNNRSEIRIGSRCMINGQLRCRADDTQILLGSGTTMMSAMITLHEPGKITLGTDCMLSGGIQMDVSDMHSIVDAETGKRLNPPQDINIGDHVWIGQGARVLKGTDIGENCVIGSRSLTSGKIPPGCVAVGTPARVVRTGITWDRRRLPWDESLEA